MSTVKTTEQSWLSFLDLKGLKQTFERKRIYDEVQRTTRHFDADQLYERFKEKQERISRDTVYRTLPLMLEAGVIQKSAGPGKRDYFEKMGAKGHHDHLICLDCEKIIEYHDERIETIQEDIYQKYRFKPAFHDHRLFGHCMDCQSKGKQD